MSLNIRLLSVLLPAGLVATLLLGACGSDASEPQSPASEATTGSVSTGAQDSDSVVLREIIEPAEPVEAPPDVPETLEVVWEVWKLLTREHIDRGDFDSAAFAEGAIRGMLAALADPHTNYVRPEAFNIENDDLLGKFEGIGANVSMRRDGRLIIVAPLRGSPAGAAGIRPGDVVLEVDGVDIQGLSLLEAVSRIRGPRGSTVLLLVLHLGQIDPVEISVIRDVIPLTSVLLRSAPGDRIAHIRLTTFYADTAEELSDTIKEAVADGAEGLILDVRDNPGGLLQSVVDVVSQFVEDGLVLYEIDGSGRRTNWKVRSGGVALEIPMVLLTNEFSASASEILAGALQDHGRATVIGATTFGKGSVNMLKRLSNGGGLYLTFARWYTPAGRLIHGNGVEPDIEVVSIDRQTAEVLQLEKAIEVLESQMEGRG